MLHATTRALRYSGVLGGFVAIAVCTLYVTKSAAQSGKDSQTQAGRLLTRVMPLRSTVSQFQPDTAIGC